MSRHVVRGSLVILLAAVASPLLATPPSFQGLGEGTQVNDISGNGQVAVGRTTALPTWAFRWEAGVLTVLGGTIVGGEEAYAASFDGGVIVGESPGRDATQAVQWQGGGMTTLVTPEGYDGPGIAFGTSANGSVIVGTVSRPHGIPTACRWEDGQPSLEEGLIMVDVSADGSVALGLTGLLWDDGTTTQLGTGTAEYNHVVTLALSANGHVAVGLRLDEPIGPWGVTSQDDPNVPSPATRWVDGVPESLGYLPGGVESFTPSDVSGDGSVIVGYTIDDPNGWVPFLPSPDGAVMWTAATGPLDLQELLASEFSLDLTGWTLTDAIGVSDDGMTIVGNGLYDEGLSDGPVAQAWIAHIPEPVSAALLVLGTGLALRPRPTPSARGARRTCAIPEHG
jgi:uncharacterized membrane protein